MVFLYPFTAPSAPPLNLMAIDVFSNRFVLSWDPPSDEYRNGIIKGYTVVTSPLGISVVSQTYTTATSIIIADLTPFTTYEARVAAHTELGVGPFSPSITVQTAEAGQSVLVHIALIWYVQGIIRLQHQTPHLKMSPSQF